MNADYVATYLDEVALDQRNQLSATGRRALGVAADTLRFLHRQHGFESDLPASRRVLKAAVREWRRCGNAGRHSDHQAGRVAGLIIAVAELRGIDDEAAKDLVRDLTRVDTPPEQMIG